MIMCNGWLLYCMYMICMNISIICLSQDWSWRYWEMLGVSKDKINIVVATYGRGFILSDPDNDGLGEWIDGPSPSGPYTEAGFLAYYDVRHCFGCLI